MLLCKDTVLCSERIFSKSQKVKRSKSNGSIMTRVSGFWGTSIQVTARPEMIWYGAVELFQTPSYVYIIKI